MAQKYDPDGLLEQFMVSEERRREYLAEASELDRANEYDNSVCLRDHCYNQAEIRVNPEDVELDGDFHPFVACDYHFEDTWESI